MIFRHVIAFLALVAALCLACTTLPLVTRRHVPAGSAREEVWKVDVLLRRLGTDKFYNTFDSQIVQIVRNGVRIEGSGPLRVLSAETDVKAAMVQWSMNDPSSIERREIHFSAPGVEMVVRVKWEADARSADGDSGKLRMVFSNKVNNAECEPVVHGLYDEKEDDGTYVTLVATAYQSGAALLLARCRYALVLALPLAAFAYSLMLAVVLYRRSRKLAASAAQEVVGIHFPASPSIDDWRHGCVMFCLISPLSVAAAAVAVAREHMSPGHEWFIWILLGVALIVAVIVGLSNRLNVVAVKMDDETVSCIKGRKEPQAWETARWEELKEMKPVTFKVKGTTHRWYKLVFPSGRVYRVNNPDCIKKLAESIKARQAALTPPAE